MGRSVGWTVCFDDICEKKIKRFNICQCVMAFARCSAKLSLSEKPIITGVSRETAIKKKDNGSQLRVWRLTDDY